LTAALSALQTEVIHYQQVGIDEGAKCFSSVWSALDCAMVLKKASARIKRTLCPDRTAA